MTAAARTLIVAPSWIGDTVLAEPLLARLAAAAPDSPIDVLAPRWVAPVLRRMAMVEEVIDSPFAHGELHLRRRWRLARQLAGRYRRAVILPNSLKSALIPALAGIPERIGFTGEARYGLINRRHHLDKQLLPLMVERYAQLAQAPGSDLVRPVAAPRLCSTPAQQQHTLRSLHLAAPARLVILCPGAEYGPAKRWPVEHFTALASQLLSRGCTVWLLGSGKDAALAEDLRNALPASLQAACHNLCGITSLDQAIDLIALADAVVCNDSGLMHVAAALARPLVALYGSSSPGFTPPLSMQAKVLSLHLECSPCFQRQCPLGHTHCLQQLRPETVLAALPEHLQ